MTTPAKNELLSLSAAAKRVGVHPSTLRRWADAGAVTVQITPGGHRRFFLSDLSNLSGGKSARPSQSAEAREDLEASSLSNARTAIDGHQARWMEVSEKEREEKRMLGRRMMGLLMQYLAAADGEGADFLVEAEAIGRIHAKSAIREGLDLADTLRAALFFRDNIVESAVLLPQSAKDQPEAQARVYRRINEFMNTIQLEIADVFDKQGSRSGPLLNS